MGDGLGDIQEVFEYFLELGYDEGLKFAIFRDISSENDLKID